MTRNSVNSSLSSLDTCPLIPTNITRSHIHTPPLTLKIQLKLAQTHANTLPSISLFLSRSITGTSLAHTHTHTCTHPPHISTRSPTPSIDGLDVLLLRLLDRLTVGHGWNASSPRGVTILHVRGSTGPFGKQDSLHLHVHQGGRSFRFRQSDRSRVVSRVETIPRRAGVESMYGGHHEQAYVDGGSFHPTNLISSLNSFLYLNTLSHPLLLSISLRSLYSGQDQEPSFLEQNNAYHSPPMLRPWNVRTHQQNQ